MVRPTHSMVMPALESLKPLLTALVLPPVPLLVLMLVGGRVVAVRRRPGTVLVLVAVSLMWLSACQGVGRWLQGQLLAATPPLASAEIAALRPGRQQLAPTAAILVLGGGRIARAPESGMADLKPHSIERLRYAVRLGRETGLPLAFSGGIGWAQTADEPGLSEAEIAQRVAERDFLRPIKWLETDSRDTRENARLAVKKLSDAGIRHIVLVTHAWHMPRALRAFREAAGDSMRITAAPMGYFVPAERALLNWLPSSEGFEQVRLVLREALGMQMGA